MADHRVCLVSGRRGPLVDTTHGDFDAIGVDVAGLVRLSDTSTMSTSSGGLDDSLRLVDRCRAVGGRAELQQSSGLFHVWPVTVPYVREARRTLADIVTFLDRELA